MAVGGGGGELFMNSFHSLNHLDLFFPKILNVTKQNYFFL